MKKNAVNNPNLFKVLFVLSAAVLLFIASLNFKHNQTIEQAAEKVIHAHKINFELEKIINCTKEGRHGLAGYIITNNSQFLAPYKIANQKLAVSLKTLRLLNKKQKAQLDILNQLEQLTDKKNTNFNQIKALLFQNKVLSNKIIQQKIIYDSVLMDSIMALTTTMSRVESSNLQKRNSIYNYQLFLNPIFTIGTVFITLIFLIISFTRINDDVKILQQSNDKLLFLKTSNDQSEILGNYSSWLWNLDTNEMTFSDNQYRLLGHEPQSFVANNANFLKFIHPEDVPLVENSIDKTISDQDLPTLYYRIIKKDNEIRYFKSSGTIIIDSYKNKILIGNTRDITDERIAKLEIEARNLELEQSNNELISFNYVASHDLQEPLRKIQTFISRFSEIDLLNLSDDGKGYFSKIGIAITKMRELIDDLLLYSRASKAEKKFELFDLNTTLERAKQELSQVIKDSKAIITTDQLPNLEIIPFQMQQLFVNIIGNAIKYAKKNSPPKIKIKCEKIIAIDDEFLLKPVATEYYKISFLDNGIGFDEQYSDKIFVLFSRLISDKEYQGSGIGLTICKKIAENHLGQLSASGTPNIGATFTLYLPVL